MSTLLAPRLSPSLQFGALSHAPPVSGALYPSCVPEDLGKAFPPQSPVCQGRLSLRTTGAQPRPLSPLYHSQAPKAA